MKCNNFYRFRKLKKKFLSYEYVEKDFGPTMCGLMVSSYLVREELNTLANKKFKIQVDIENKDCIFLKNRNYKIQECPCFNMTWEEVLKNPFLNEARNEINITAGHELKNKTVYYDKKIHGRGKEFFCTILYGRQAVSYLLGNRGISTSKAVELGGEIKYYFFDTLQERQEFEEKCVNNEEYGITHIRLLDKSEVEFYK